MVLISRISAIQFIATACFILSTSGTYLDNQKQHLKNKKKTQYYHITSFKYLQNFTFKEEHFILKLSLLHGVV